MNMKPFINIVIAMDEKNAIGFENKTPWGFLPTDHNWYLTHSTTLKDRLKRVAVITGRVTFEGIIKFSKEYLSKWHFIVISKQTQEELHRKFEDLDKNNVDIVNSLEQATHRAKLLLDTPSAMIESVFLFGGVNPYEQALELKLVKRVYLTRIFAEVPNCDARVSKFDLSDFQRVKRPSGEVLAELDDQIIEENGWKYQFQVYDLQDS
ncbi:unnamed protein product [Rotaria magnacalcarata]|uniref:dihydrofolate reductase n=5 Tax=Rotaria magnacalcarata TaxID=392030 RepID=A0A816V220_9BILA|nr:unnamed protein product [Rotaria magnacalcarata]CAF2120658.1 unnamed protein product [Rotaria magnacalcarata]